jgi:TonB family protein
MRNNEMTNVTRQMLLLVSALWMWLGLTAQPAWAQAHDHNGPDRKVVTRVEPDYPETLKRLYIGGVVRVEVVVTPAGAVESTQLLGGNPILGQSAMKAIKQWKFAPASSKATFVVPLTFDPHQ